MAEKIQAVPKGLLDVLGVKSLGVNPSQQPETVQSTIDLTRFYFVDKAETFRSQAAAISLAGAGVTEAIPDDEIWLVQNLAVRLFTFSLAPNNASASIFISAVGGPVCLTPFQEPTTIVTAATDQVNRGVSFPTPILVPGGLSLIFSLDRTLSAGTCTLDATGLIYRIAV